MTWPRFYRLLAAASFGLLVFSAILRMWDVVAVWLVFLGVLAIGDRLAGRSAQRGPL